MLDIKYLLACTAPLSAIIALSYKGLFSYSTLIYAFVFVPILELMLNEQKRDNEFDENQKESPQLPFGYPTSMLISMIPPLWYRLMHSRLV